MSEVLSARGRRTQFLGILIVGGLIVGRALSAVLWLSVAGNTAALFFCMGVSVFALLAVYAGKLIVDEEHYMQARLEARDARYRQTLELLPEGVVILKGERASLSGSTPWRPFISGSRPRMSGRSFATRFPLLSPISARG